MVAVSDKPTKLAIQAVVLSKSRTQSPQAGQKKKSPGSPGLKGA